MKNRQKTVYVTPVNLEKLEVIKEKKAKFSLSSEVNKVIEKLYEAVK